jgi:hypothetical protein
MPKPLKATFRHSDFRDDSPVMGSFDEIVSLFRRIDWAAAYHEHAEPWTFPELIVEREANGDVFNLQFLGPSGLFQCATIISIPRPVLGFDIWLTRDLWESDAVEFAAGAVIDALAAFSDRDATRLRSLWAHAAVPQ